MWFRWLGQGTVCFNVSSLGLSREAVRLSFKPRASRMSWNDDETKMECQAQILSDIGQLHFLLSCVSFLLCKEQKLFLFYKVNNSMNFRGRLQQWTPFGIWVWEWCISFLEQERISIQSWCNVGGGVYFTWSTVDPIDCHSPSFQEIYIPLLCCL